MPRLMAKQRPNPTKSSRANLGLKQKLWAAADKLRGHIRFWRWKPVIPILVFPIHQAQHTP